MQLQLKYVHCNYFCQQVNDTIEYLYYVITYNKTFISLLSNLKRHS